jgi:hypothetical protein
MFSALRFFFKRENLTWIGATVVVASAVTYLVRLPTNQPPAIEKHPRSSEQLDNAIHEKEVISSELTHKQCAENTSASELHSDTNRVETAADLATSTSDQTKEEEDQEEEGKEEDNSSVETSPSLSSHGRETRQLGIAARCLLKLFEGNMDGLNWSEDLACDLWECTELSEDGEVMRSLEIGSKNCDVDKLKFDISELSPCFGDDLRTLNLEGCGYVSGKHIMCSIL